MTLMDPTGSHQRLLLTAALRTQGPILELGAGWYSTPILHAVAAAQGRQLLTLDNNADWLARFTPKEPCKHHWLRLVQDWLGPGAGLLPLAVTWGLVFVDPAPPLVRGELVKRLRDVTDVFVLHDTEAPGAYGYDDLPSFPHQVTDKSHWTWTTVCSDRVDVAAWGLGDFPSEEAPPSVEQYLLKVFPGVGRWFVEAGAHSKGNATLGLERAGWSGLCVEPSTHHEDLASNRRCLVYPGLLGPRDDYCETFRQYHGDGVQHSGIIRWLPENVRLETIKRWDDRQLCTVRLSTLLDVYSAPALPEFLSLNTNGSELAILRGHDWDRYRFRVVLVNYGGSAERRRELDELMTAKGYGKSRGRGWDDGTNLTFVDAGVPG